MLLSFLRDLAQARPASLHGATVELIFGTGSHGLESSDTKVVTVTHQAHLLGVKPGWIILAINKIACTSNDIDALLSTACKSGRPYPIVFVTDQALIRAAEAKSREIARMRQRKANEIVAKEIAARKKAPDNTLSAAKEARLRSIFDMCRRAGDEAISKPKLIQVCQENLGIAAFFGVSRLLRGEQLKASLDAFFRYADSNGDATLSWGELKDVYLREGQAEPTSQGNKPRRGFPRSVSSLACSSPRERKMWEIFGACDTSRDGRIERKELIRAIRRDSAVAKFFNLPERFNKACDVEELEQFLFAADADGDGQMTFEEFKAFDQRTRSDRDALVQTLTVGL